MEKPDTSKNADSPDAIPRRKAISRLAGAAILGGVATQIGQLAAQVEGVEKPKDDLDALHASSFPFVKETMEECEKRGIQVEMVYYEDIQELKTKISEARYKYIKGAADKLLGGEEKQARGLQSINAKEKGVVVIYGERPPKKATIANEWIDVAGFLYFGEDADRNMQTLKALDAQPDKNAEDQKKMKTAAQEYLVYRLTRAFFGFKFDPERLLKLGKETQHWKETGVPTNHLKALAVNSDFGKQAYRIYLQRAINTLEKEGGIDMDDIMDSIDEEELKAQFQENMDKYQLKIFGKADDDNTIKLLNEAKEQIITDEESAIRWIGGKAGRAGDAEITKAGKFNQEVIAKIEAAGMQEIENYKKLERNPGLGIIRSSVVYDLKGLTLVIQVQFENKQSRRVNVRVPVNEQMRSTIMKQMNQQ